MSGRLAQIVSFNRFLLVFPFFLTLLMGAVTIDGWFLGVPVRHLKDRLSNDYARSEDANKQRLAEFLLSTGIAADWRTSELGSGFPQISNWKGQGASPEASYKSQKFNWKRPLPGELGLFAPVKTGQIRYIQNNKSFLKAINEARSGDVLQLRAGTYDFKGRSIDVLRPGTPEAPIIVRAAKLGDVKIKLDMLEGFTVRAPYWVFENLEIIGNCERDSRCEHAFHVVKGGSFVLRNNRIQDFNAPLKVNASGPSNDRQIPDFGLVEFNSFFNTRQRNTSNPVTLLDIVAVDEWTVRGNLIADFSKGQGNLISYGAFMKGGGSHGVFEDNLVICEMNLPPDRGLRIGLSFGGGGTSGRACRTNHCGLEFRNGVMRNNLILNCSRDVGVYLNRATDTRIHNNVLHRTLGLDVRFDSSSAVIYNNIISGRIRLRDGGVALISNNRVDPHCFRPGSWFGGCDHDEWFADLTRADLTLIKGGEILGEGLLDSEYERDFCGTKPLKSTVDIGPIQFSAGSKCNPSRMKRHLE